MTPSSCALAMKDALSNSNGIRPQAREYAKGYSVEESVLKLVDLYKFAIEHKKATLNGKIF